MKNKETIIYDKNTPEYVIKLKKTNWWWLLLFLIPLLLLIFFIRIPATVNFKVLDTNSKIIFSGSNVSFEYTDRQFIKFKPFKFSSLDTLIQSKTTDENGIASFKVKYTLFHRLFFTKDLATATANGTCFQRAFLTDNYFKLIKNKINEINVSPVLKQYDFVVIDATDKQVLPDADVTITMQIGDKQQTYTLKSDARGIVETSIFDCADKVTVNASKYGYLPYSVSNKAEYFKFSENRILPLQQKFSPIKFTVKDLYTKKPVTNATAEIVFDNSAITATTNTDGLGKAMFDSVANSKKFYIKVSHPAYYDTTSQTYTVEQFVNMTDDQRTIYIRPKPGNLTFKDVDAKTHNPIEGAKNVVTVNGQNVGEYYSNTDGEFVVPNLKPTDRISITASKEGYLPNNQTINNKTVSQLNTEEKRTIPLNQDETPQNVEPPRENCRAHFSGTLLSDNYIDGHISTIYKPDEYGEYVGEGEYPNNTVAFPNAVQHTFDAIAVDKGTRVIVYSQPNFQGNVLLDVTGPAVINNVKWKDEARIKDFTRKTFVSPYESWFPKSCRRWSSSNMNDWSYGSVKVICNQ